MEEKFYSDERSLQIIMSLMKAHGVRKVIASPGATNLTLVASMQQDPFFEMYSSVDERSAAYMACGMAAESGEPVAITCTGATSSRNYMPGLTEAYYRKLPVLALTANQGAQKIGQLIAQNIDRSVVPNDIAKMSVQVPAVESKHDVHYCTLLVNKALLELRHNGGGPVHINFTTIYSRNFDVKELPKAVAINRYTLSDVSLPGITVTGNIGIFIGSHRKFTVEETEAVDSFCDKYNAVCFCDHTSGYHGRYRYLHALVGVQPAPNTLRNLDLLIHIGEVSGNYYGMGLSAKQVWRVSEDGELRDFFGTLSNVFEMPEARFFRHYASVGKGMPEKKGAYLDSCLSEYRDVYSHIPELPFGNIWVAKQMAGKLPSGSILHLGILNTLRSWDFFDIPKDVDAYCNVGAFGIDGIMSTLLGASLASPDKICFGILGDLAFFYDMNSIGNRHVARNLRIMLINNGRGTEFTNYGHPGHAFGEVADPYIAAAGHYGNKSHKLVKHYAEDLGFKYLSASNKDEFLAVYKEFVTPEQQPQPMLFEVFTDSKDESDALEMMCNIRKAPLSVKKLVKNTIKDVVGEQNIRKIRKALK